MSIYKQYNQNTQKLKNNKNPNRVAGGIRGAGADYFVHVDESGKEHRIPSHGYVQALEQKILLQSDQIKKLLQSTRRMRNE